MILSVEGSDGFFRNPNIPAVKARQAVKDKAWKLAVARVGKACKKVPDLATLTLSIHLRPHFSKLEDEDAVRQSLRVLDTAAGQVRAELLQLDRGATDADGLSRPKYRYVEF
jgi:hypothetical protein